MKTSVRPVWKVPRAWRVTPAKPYIPAVDFERGENGAWQAVETGAWGQLSVSEPSEADVAARLGKGTLPKMVDAVHNVMRVIGTKSELARRSGNLTGLERSRAFANFVQSRLDAAVSPPVRSHGFDFGLSRPGVIQLTFAVGRGTVQYDVVTPPAFTDFFSAKQH